MSVLDPRSAAAACCRCARRLMVAAPAEPQLNAAACFESVSPFCQLHTRQSPSDNTRKQAYTASNLCIFVTLSTATQHFPATHKMRSAELFATKATLEQVN